MPDTPKLKNPELQKKFEDANQKINSMELYCHTKYLAEEELPKKGVWQMRQADCEVVQQALTALRDEVVRLEKENEGLKQTLFDGRHDRF